MKQIFTLIILGITLLMSGTVVYSETTMKVSTVDSYSYSIDTEKPDTPLASTSYYYNAEGQLVMELTSSNKITYAYNEQGLKSEAVTYYWGSSTNVWTFSSKSVYEYDSEGKLIKENSLNANDEVIAYTLFENYINGYYEDRKAMSADGSMVTYWSHFDYTFENGLLSTGIQSYISGEDTTVLSKTDYEYTNDLLTTEEASIYYEGQYLDTLTGAYSIVYNYNENNNLLSEVQTSVSRWGYYVSEKEYVYQAYSPDYAPTNLQVVAKTGDGSVVNTVQLTWTASASAEVTGYQVICDTLISEIITGSSYTTANAAFNGDHTYAVLAVVNGTTRNISNSVSLTLFDDGVIPAENLSILSVSDVKEDGSYDLSVSWDAPETTSSVESYKVYYDEWGSSIETTETSTIVNIPSWSAVGYSEDGDTYGLDIGIFVAVGYSTGFSENSDTVRCNPYDGVIYTGIRSVQLLDVDVYPNPATEYINFSENVAVKLYNLSGKVVKSSTFCNQMEVADLKNGIYLIQLTNKLGRTNTSKLSIIR